MKISYNWLNDYIKTDLSPKEIGVLLTDCGLEVESIEKFETIKGGLQGLVVGEVITKEKHPDADKLSVTTVNIGTGRSLNIVCGASNVEVGQKVIVATIGSILYPIIGEPFEIKKSKIRGVVSEGMICAEDEVGLGNSHDGIMVLNSSAKAGIPANEYFKIEVDYTLEIGLTPNRSDAASHVGVARDLVAVLNSRITEAKAILQLPAVDNFQVDKVSAEMEVVIEDANACPRYSGVSINNISVGDSPEWMKNRLKAIGIRSINNIVDATNYVLHELGQPLHAFDADKITGNKIIVKKLADKTKFTTLDEIERELSSEDLMICDAKGGLCIAGVFGGIDASVTEKTRNIFLESAYFKATGIRKSSKRHNLKTDASFRYERGADPNNTVYALKRLALLIKEIAGGEISSPIIDIYPTKIENVKIPFSFEKCDQLIGKHLDTELIKNIITSLGIEIEHEGKDALLLSIPPYKADIWREQDVIEEVLRIYGYNNIEIPTALNSCLTFSEKPNKEKAQNVVSEVLTNNGFSEIMCLSLTKSEYAKKLKSLDGDRNVVMMNPLSTDLHVLRQTLLFGGLETIAYNQNRKNTTLKLYEFGKTYMAVKAVSATKYVESKHLSIFITGRKQEERWNAKNDLVNLHTLKGFVESIFERLGITDLKIAEYSGDLFSHGASYSLNNKCIVEFGEVSPSVLKSFAIKQEVFYADFNWDTIIDAIKATTVNYQEVSKFPEVRRDLALLVDKAIRFEQLEQLAFQSEKKWLTDVNLFDVYEGGALPEGKKSYALSFTLQDETATLTDKQIEKTMDKLIKLYQEKIGAEIR